MFQWSSCSWSDWDKWSPQRSWFAEVSLPSSWKSTEIHYDETVLHGYPLYRYVQPSASGIGSEISPTLSSSAVTLIERSWSSTYHEVLNQPHFHHLKIRYVDNRFVIVQKHHLQTPAFQVFADLDFYGSPVELELVEDNLLLGFYVGVFDRTIIYKLPGICQIRGNVSAGTLRLRLSGLKSRAHLIRKYSYPSCQAQSSLHELARLYVQKGFAWTDIYSALWPTNNSGDRPSCVGSTPVSKGLSEFVNCFVFQF